MKRIIITLLICSLCGVMAQAQQRLLRGTVRDASGLIPGATIFEKEFPGNGTITNENGTFQLNLRGQQQTLIVKLVGYLQKEVNVTGKSDIAITIEVDVKGLEEVVIVGYGQSTKLTNTIAQSTVLGDEIRRTPTASLQNALVGKLPGFFSQQRSGQPGADGAVFTIRGTTSFSENRSNGPLIIVDDVEYTGNFADIDPEQVNSVTILKDAASAAVYGIKGANGVIVVTTIRGTAGKPQISLKSNTGLQGYTMRPHFLNAYDHARLRNQALASDGLPPEWTQEDLDAWKNGTDPFGHPDNDWWDILIKKTSLQTKNNLSIRGGVDKMKYFVSVGHLFQDGILNDFQDATSQVNTNFYLKRYNYRTNLDLQVTKTLDLSLDLVGYFSEQNEPNSRGRANRNRIFFEIFDYKALPPHAYPIYNPDGTYGAATESVVTGPTNNVVGRLRLGGYRRNYESDIQINLRGVQKLPFIAKGLSLTGLLSYQSNQDFRRSLTRTNFLSYIYNAKTKVYTPFNEAIQRDEKYTLDAPSSSTLKRLNLQVSLNYDTTFNNKHRVYALALVNQFSATNGADIPENFRGYTYRLGYDYKKKYMLELSGSYNGTDRFKAAERYGFFPAVSGGWNISEEPFFKEKIKFIDLLKIRGSLGLTGSDDIGGNQYLYDYVYEEDSDWNYNFGQSQKNYRYLKEGTLGNDNVSWEKERQWNIGTDINFFKNKLSFNFDLFHKRRNDILLVRQSLSDIIGIGLPPANLASISNKGYEINVDYRNKIKKFNYHINANVARAKNRIEYMDEGFPAYPWLRQTGGQTGRVRGYTYAGFYDSEEDIAKSAKPLGAPPKPGDLKYADLNGDGIIDPYDQRYLDNSNNPTMIYGLTLGGEWKGFSFSITLQSATNFTVSAVAEAVTPFFGNLRSVHLNAWTPENKANATFPRLSTLDNISNARTNMSDYWQVKGDYIKLRNAEIGYKLPKRWIQTLRLSDVRLYANSSNIFTWMLGPNLYDLDPEVVSGTDGGVYPNMKVFNFGINVNF